VSITVSILPYDALTLYYILQIKLSHHLMPLICITHGFVFIDDCWYLC